MRQLSITVAVFGLLVCGSVAAADLDDVRETASRVRGDVSVWGQGVFPTNALDDGLACDNGGTEFCGNVGGYGGSVRVLLPIHNGWSVIGDFTHDFHIETNSIPASRDRHAWYNGAALHLIRSSGAWHYGAFAIGAYASEHAEGSDSTGLMLGGGFEARWNNMFVQAGAVVDHRFVSREDSIENMYFVRGGGEHQLGRGRIDASLAFGAGDFEDSRSFYQLGYWFQAAIQYEAPIHTSGLHWFVGYQGDFVRVEGTPEQAFFHAAKVGITMAFGDPAQRRLPFTTPNLRAPLANASEMN